MLALLNEQSQPNVPFSHTIDLTTDAPARMCLQDVGDTYRPVSLAPISDEALRQEAAGLAAIHYRNLGQNKTLGWLPRVDSTYVKARVLDIWWRPAWEKALRNAPLRQVLDPHIPAVEQAAVRLAGDMEPLLSDPHTQTLVHTDIHPSNVLVHEGRPFYIDWSATHYGSLYLDLPHHFCTREQAEHYRAALAAYGEIISTTDFDASYRAAARLIGFRYLWWTLAGWRGSVKDTAWVMHYVSLIRDQV